MPAVEAGALFIWVIAAFLFLSVTAGGTFLLLYITHPEPEDSSTAWYPVIGVTLVAMPWFFWIITFLYRVISRTFGFRMVCWEEAGPGPSPGAAPGEALGGGDGTTTAGTADSNESETPLKMSMAS